MEGRGENSPYFARHVKLHVKGERSGNGFQSISLIERRKRARAWTLGNLQNNNGNKGILPSVSQITLIGACPLSLEGKKVSGLLELCKCYRGAFKPTAAGLVRGGLEREKGQITSRRTAGAGRRVRRLTRATGPCHVRGKPTATPRDRTPAPRKRRRRPPGVRERTDNPLSPCTLKRRSHLAKSRSTGTGQVGNRM